MAQTSHAASQPAETTTSRMAWRTWVPWALVVLAAIIGLVAALNVWVKRQALSTDNWTNASGRLLEDPKIRGAISVYLVNQIYQNVNVPQALEQRLPPQAKGLAPQIAVALQQVAVRAANALLARPRIQQLWKAANRRAHQLFMALLNGHHNVLVSSGGNVVLNLQPILQALADQTGLGARLKASLPPDAGKITIMKGSQLENARRGVKVIRVLSYLLLFLVIALYAVAIWIAKGRRRKLLMGVGISVVVVGLLILVVRRFVGNYLVDQLTTNPTDKGAIHDGWLIGTELLRNVGVNTLIYGIVIVFAAWIAGASRPATWCRRTLAPTMRDHAWAIYGAVTLVLIIILLAGPTDAQRIFPLLILFVFAYIGTEVLRRQTLREFPETGPPRVTA